MSHSESGQFTTGNPQLTMEDPALNTRHSPLDWAIRAYQEGDIPGIVALWNAAFEADGLGDIKIGEEEQRIQFGRPDFDPVRQVIIVGGPTEGVPHGMLPGFGMVEIRDDKEASERIYNLLTIAHPTVRER